MGLTRVCAIILACAVLQQLAVAHIGPAVNAVVEVPEDVIVAESPSSELMQAEAAEAKQYTAVRRDHAKMSSDERSTDGVMATLERDRKEFQAKNHIKAKKTKKKAKATVWTPKAQKVFQKTSEAATDNVLENLERHRKEFHVKNHIKKAIVGKAKSRKGKSRKGKSRKGKSRKGKSRKGKSRKGKSRKGKSRKGKSRKGKSRKGKSGKKVKKAIVKNKAEKVEKTAAKKLKEILKREAATQKAVKQHTKLAHLLDAKHNEVAQKRKEKKRKLARKGKEIARKARKENERDIKIQQVPAYGSAWRHRVRKFENDYTSVPEGRGKVSSYQAKMVDGIMAKPDGSASYFVPDLADWHPSAPVSKAKLESLRAWVKAGQATGSGATVKYDNDCEMWCTSASGKSYCCQPVGDPMPVFPGMATPKEDPIPVKEPALTEDTAM